MNEMIEIDELLWSSPVRVRIGYGFPETIRGPREALEYLKWRWPVRDGDNYINALSDCAACLQQKMSADRVRESFVLASIEASMLG